MKRSRRTFDPSFKLEVVNTIKNQGLSVSQVAKDMNLTESIVLRWVQQVDDCGPCAGLKHEPQRELPGQRGHGAGLAGRLRQPR